MGGDAAPDPGPQTGIAALRAREVTPISEVQFSVYQPGRASSPWWQGRPVPRSELVAAFGDGGLHDSGRMLLPTVHPRAASGRAPRARQRSSRLLWAAAIVVSMVSSGGPAAADPGAGVAAVDSRAAITGPTAGSATEAVDLAALGWVWPAEPFRLVRPFAAPAHEYGPGHRGIDLDLVGGEALRAPADGVVAFAGSVAGRGILTIDHGGGLVTTLEPAASDLAPGTIVARGAPVATLGSGGHAAAGTVHFGVRLDGRYINPLLLLGDIPRAVLLPCC